MEEINGLNGPDEGDQWTGWTVLDGINKGKQELSLLIDWWGNQHTMYILSSRPHKTKISDTLSPQLSSPVTRPSDQ